MASLHFLTVPDMLYINFQLTKKKHRYNYATLEEATFLQYSYGTSKDLNGQAIRFLSEFPRLKPFVHGNRATAFVGFVAFLMMNDHSLEVSDEDALAFVTDLAKSKDAAALAAKLGHSHLHGRLGAPDGQAAVQQILTQFPKTCAALLDAESPAVIS